MMAALGYASRYALCLAALGRVRTFYVVER